MKLAAKQIHQAFKQQGIFLKDPVDASKKQIIPGSITNEFLKVQDVKGNEYLIRINGKLWPPFTREGEHYNLTQLRVCNIDTTVIVNDIKNGFQICYSRESCSKLSAIPHGERHPDLLRMVSQSVKKFHDIGDFHNNYPIASTINSTINRLCPVEQKKLSSYQAIIFKILYALNEDIENRVSSHNDLLPSSVYIKGDGISFVDWEYSAENHRSYDLAFLSIKCSLTSDEEDIFLSAYDHKNFFDLKYSVAMMKPVIMFLLLLWNMSSKQPNLLTSKLLLNALDMYLQQLVGKKSANLMRAEVRLCLFDRPLHEKPSKLLPAETETAAPTLQKAMGSGLA